MINLNKYLFNYRKKNKNIILKRNYSCFFSLLKKKKKNIIIVNLFKQLLFIIINLENISNYLKFWSLYNNLPNNYIKIQNEKEKKIKKNYLIIEQWNIIYNIYKEKILSKYELKAYKYNKYNIYIEIYKKKWLKKYKFKRCKTMKIKANLWVSPNIWKKGKRKELIEIRTLKEKYNDWKIVKNKEEKWKGINIWYVPNLKEGEWTFFGYNPNYDIENKNRYLYYTEKKKN